MSRFSRLFFLQAFVLLLVAVFHSSAEYFSWYYIHPNLDIPMHFLGGLWVSLAAYWVLRDVLRFSERTMRVYVFLLITVLFVGLLWEWFELFIHMIAIDKIDMQDSLKDLCMDLLGGFTGCTLIRRNLV